jgi:F0F1-type ATP synthase gamma subunit
LPTARDLQRQINTVKNQARVFSALQTVSSVKFRKAEARVKRARLTLASALRNFTEETVCRAEKTLAWFFTVLICL